jgi:Tfp pilus assembly protein PilF
VIPLLLRYAQGDLESARHYLVKALEIDKSIGRLSSLPYIYRKLATVAKKEKDYSSAEAYAKDSRKLFSQFGSVYDVHEVDNLIKEIEEESRHNHH